MQDNDKEQQLRVPANDRFAVPPAPEAFKNLFDVFNGKAVKLAEEVRDILKDQPADLAVSAITHLLLAKAQQKFALESLQRENDKLQKRVGMDSLTGVFNKGHMIDELQRHYDAEPRAERRHTDYHVLMIDLDGFKGINDTFGHNAGDEALKQVAALLTKNTRVDDVVARMGGDEFVVFLKNMPDEAAIKKAKHIEAQLNELVVEYDGKKFVMGGTVGHAKFDAHKNYQANLGAADQDMYQRKHAKGDTRFLKPKLA